ncbi:hypothetical protein O181_026511 [Austropuccinia psidii MF-1]|uniref:Uncharacterized protein n=1 Tax=Austropuccinia psidii MF-1 TaxID=1389203 RepID=A0A9Q3CKK3_9BASI|nr:hypothetical protein [Austropuccinia psidii MF-1]
MHPNQERVMTVHQEKKLMVDEDENMSPTQSETRRDYLTVHEEGTWANSEFTHPQMPISQSILNQSKMRQKKKKAFKAHNVVKGMSQKEKKIFLKEELPDNVHGMRSDVHAHFLFLLKVKDMDFSSLPAPQSTEEGKIEIKFSHHLGYGSEEVFNEP